MGVSVDPKIRWRLVDRGRDELTVREGTADEQLHDDDHTVCTLSISDMDAGDGDPAYANGELIAAARNAIVQGAAHLKIDPLIFARLLDRGGMEALVKTARWAMKADDRIRELNRLIPILGAVAEDSLARIHSREDPSA